VEIVSEKGKVSAVFGIFRSTTMSDHQVWVNNQAIDLKFRERMDGNTRLGEVLTDDGWVVVRTTPAVNLTSYNADAEDRHEKFIQKMAKQESAINEIICWIEKQMEIKRGARFRVAREFSNEGILHHCKKDGLDVTCHEVSLAIKKMSK
jgi:head-tail adaptor